MNKIFLILCVSSVLLSLCACGKGASQKKAAGAGSSASAAAAAGSTAISETDTAGSTASSENSSSAGTAAGVQEKEPGTVSIELTPPEGWADTGSSVLAVHYMKGTASLMVKAEAFTGSTLDEVAAQALDIYQRSFENFKVITQAEPATVDGKDARTLTFTCTVSKLNMKYTYVFLFAADQCYVITFADLADNFDSLAADYEAILNNIRFVTE